MKLPAESVLAGDFGSSQVLRSECLFVRIVAPSVAQAENGEDVTCLLEENMQITLEIPDDITQDHSLDEADWLREIAIALFKQELITLGRASSIARMHLSRFSEVA